MKINLINYNTVKPIQRNNNQPIKQSKPEEISFGRITPKAGIYAGLFALSTIFGGYEVHKVLNRNESALKNINENTTTPHNKLNNETIAQYSENLKNIQGDKLSLFPNKAPKLNYIEQDFKNDIINSTNKNDVMESIFKNEDKLVEVQKNFLTETLVKYSNIDKDSLTPNINKLFNNYLVMFNVNNLEYVNNLATDLSNLSIEYDKAKKEAEINNSKESKEKLESINEQIENKVIEFTKKFNKEDFGIDEYSKKEKVKEELKKFYSELNVNLNDEELDQAYNNFQKLKSEAIDNEMSKYLLSMLSMLIFGMLMVKNITPIKPKEKQEPTQNAEGQA